MATTVPSTYHPLLASVIQHVDADLHAVGMTRRRGGNVRGTAWVEASGRAEDGAWYELRLHYRPAEQTLAAGLLAYQPLARGGRSIVVGEATIDISRDLAAVSHLAEQILRWIGGSPRA